MDVPGRSKKVDVLGPEHSFFPPYFRTGVETKLPKTG
jgi:hypothetical protein